MDISFKCPACEQELEVDASGAGSEIECPACGETILIPGPPPEAPPMPEINLNPISTSAAAKEEKHFKVSTTEVPTQVLIKKASKPLEFAAQESDRVLRIKTVRRSECVDSNKDKFDQVVSDLLQKIGEKHLIAMYPVNYSHIDPTSQKLVADYGVIIYFRG
jgi:DNA-directed RNA polymerase subunit RPC12/RpoP